MYKLNELHFTVYNMTFCLIICQNVAFLLAVFNSIMAAHKSLALVNKNHHRPVDSMKSHLNDPTLCQKGMPSTICVPADYNKEVGPWEYRHLTNTSMPWIFIINFYIYDIQEINDEKLTITFDGYFKIRWMEPRLRININSDDWSTHATNVDGQEHYLIPLDHINDLWVPGIEMDNLEQFQPQKVLGEIASLRINRTMFLRYVVKVKIILSCQMSFDKYPFDSNRCLFRIGSFYHSEEIWNCSSAVDFNLSRQRNTPYNIDVFDLSQEHLSYEDILSGRKFAACGFEINLERKTTQIFVQVYLTSALLVILAWVSFVINPNVVPGRMGLLVTVFLVLINIFVSVKYIAPLSNGFANAVDIFQFICIGHVFLGFVEYALILFGYGQQNVASSVASINAVQQFETNLNQVKTTSAIHGVGLIENIGELQYPNQSRYQKNRLDRISLFAYPITFTLSSLIYFYVYLN